jgi:hypothetical protein
LPNPRQENVVKCPRLHIVQKKLQYAPRYICRHSLSFACALAPESSSGFDRDRIGKHKPRGKNYLQKPKRLRHLSFCCPPPALKNGYRHSFLDFSVTVKSHRNLTEYATAYSRFWLSSIDNSSEIDRTHNGLQPF